MEVKDGVYYFEHDNAFRILSGNALFCEDKDGKWAGHPSEIFHNEFKAGLIIFLGEL